MKADKKLIFPIFVFILLVISIVYRILNPFVQRETDQLKYTGTKSVKKEIKAETLNIHSDKKTASVVELFLEKKGVSGKVYRDLFTLYTPKKKVKKQHQNFQPKPKVNTKPVNQDEVKKITLNEIKEYLTSYQWYGTYKSQEKRAVFLAKNKQVLVAKTGDRLEGKYLIEDIQDKYLKIKALDLNETLQLDMREFSNE